MNYLIFLERKLTLRFINKVVNRIFYKHLMCYCVGLGIRPSVKEGIFPFRIKRYQYLKISKVATL